MTWLQRLWDLFLPLFVAAWLWPDAVTGSPALLAWVLGFGVLWVALTQLLGGYRFWLQRSKRLIVGVVLQSAVLAAAGVWALSLLWSAPLLEAFVTPVAPVVLGQAWLWSVAVAVGYRLLIYAWMGWVRWRLGRLRRVVICGGGQVGASLAQTLAAAPGLGYQLVGVFDDAPEPDWARTLGVARLGDLQAVTQPQYQGAFDEVFICLPLECEGQIKALMDQLADSTKVVKFVPDLFAFDLMHQRFEDLHGLPVFSVYDSPLMSVTAQWVKRGLDLAVSLLVLGLLWPLLLMIAAGVKWTSSGPVLFKQVRYGLDGREIKVYKFRTMTVMENGERVAQATRNDPRVTPLGRWLRRTSLDELPQFYNVLQGRMSVVGPRPHAKAHNELYRDLVPRYMQRHLVKPGITGWAQVNGWRGETDTLEKMQKRVEFDLHYIKHWSFWLDIKIMGLTLFALKSQC